VRGLSEALPVSLRTLFENDRLLFGNAFSGRGSKGGHRPFPGWTEGADTKVSRLTVSLDDGVVFTALAGLSPAEKQADPLERRRSRSCRSSVLRPGPWSAHRGRRRRGRGFDHVPPATSPLRALMQPPAAPPPRPGSTGAQRHGSRARRLFPIGAVEKHRVHVRVQLQIGRRALTRYVIPEGVQRDHRSALSAWWSSPLSVEAKHRLHEDPRQRRHQPPVVPNPLSPRERHREHPLPQIHGWQHVLDDP
jgi:hypothetical protein